MFAISNEDPAGNLAGLDEVFLEEEVTILAERRLARLAHALVLSPDPNLRSEDAAHLLCGKRYRYLADLVQDLRAADELPFELRPMGPKRLVRDVSAENLERFLRFGLGAVARYGVARHHRPGRMEAPIAVRADIFHTTLEDLVAAGQDPREALDLARRGILQRQQAVTALAAVANPPWASEPLAQFHKYISLAISEMDKLVEPEYEALQATSITVRGVEQAMALVDADGHGYTRHRYVLVGLILELAHLTDRTTGSQDDIDQARFESVRTNLQRARR